MSDSRSEIRGILNRRLSNFSILARFGLLILVTIGAYFFANLIDPGEINDGARITLFLTVWSLGLWITEAVPPFTVGILIIGTLAYALGPGNLTQETYDVSKYTNTWSSPVIWLLLGGFFLSKGMEKTKLDRELFNITVTYFGQNARRLILGLMILSGIGSMFMSNTAATAMIIVSVTPFLNSKNSSESLNRSILIAVPAAATIGGMGTIIGSSSNAIAVGALNTNGFSVSFLDWMIIGFPCALVLILLFYYFIVWKNKISRDKVAIPKVDLNVSDRSKNDFINRRITLLILLVTVGLWLTSGMHNLPVAGTAGIPIVFLTLLGVIGNEEIRTLPWDTLILVAGGLALGKAIEDTGLALYYVEQIQDYSQGWSPLVFILMFGYLTVLMSNFMSNTATAAIIIPLVIPLFPGNEIVVSIFIALSSSAALLLPISTPPNAIAFGTGMLKQKNFFPSGLFIGLIGPLVILGIILLILSFR